MNQVAIPNSLKKINTNKKGIIGHTSKAYSQKFHLTY